MSIFLIILGTLLLLDLAWWRFSDRRLRGTKGWRVFNTVFLLVQILSFGYIFVGRLLESRWNLPTPVMTSIYLWHLFVLPILLTIEIAAIPVLIFLLIRRLLRPRIAVTPALEKQRQSLVRLIKKRGADAVVSEQPSVQSRRQFLITAATVAPPLLNIALTGFSQKQIEEFRVREMTLAIPDLPPALSGMTICHVTDLHVGPFTSERVVRRVAETINQLRADLVLFTGDLINSKLTELPLGVDFIRSIEARHAVATVEGNHDLFEGRAAFETAFRAAGLHLLVNDTETFTVRGHPVQILGLRWGGSGENTRASNDTIIRASMRELLTLRRNDGSFPILLAHHPHAFDPAREAGLPLTLSGHTHGGQLMLNPEIGAGPLMFRYWSGLYQKANSQLVVGNGVGNWFPLRTAAPAEIIQLTLRRAG